MLRFERVRDAPAAASAIATGAAVRGLPPARAGIATGPLIRRDGDYFGHTVNLAARICDAANAGTVTATLDVAERTPDLRWIPLGRTSLKGIPDPVELARLDAGA
jgi:adenylate cyclase